MPVITLTKSDSHFPLLDVSSYDVRVDGTLIGTVTKDPHSYFFSPDKPWVAKDRVNEYYAFGTRRTAVAFLVKQAS